MTARTSGLRVRLTVAVAAASLAVLPAGAATLVVTATADSGPGSLRQAITDANATADADTIAFAIPAGLCSAGGVCTIVLNGSLPQITQPLVIDGATQPVAGSAPANVCATADAPSYLRVEVVQQSGVPGDRVFDIAAPATVRGVAMGGTQVNAIVLGSAAATLQCNHFGISGDGAATLGTGLSIGVCLSCTGFTTDALIGTDGDGVDDVGERNVFGGGSGMGVYVNTGTGNVIAGNYFGLASDGVTVSALPNAVFLRQSAGGNRIGSDLDGISDFLERNLFANASGYGVYVNCDAGAGDGNLVVGNWFGLDAQAQSAPNQHALRLGSSAGAHVAAGNRFAGNSAAVAVDLGSTAWLDAGSTGNCIAGNSVGLEHGGTAAALSMAGNWWGDVDGPGGVGSGGGDSILETSTGTVSFAPWLSAAPASCASGLFADGFEPGDTRSWSTVVP